MAAKVVPDNSMGPPRTGRSTCWTGLAWLLRRAAGLSGDGNGGDRGESDAFAIFNDAQDHLLRTARVHIDRVVLEAFVGAVERCPSPAARALLSRVCDMYVLASIEGISPGRFLAQGRLTAVRAKSATGTVNALCELLRPHAQVLVDAFAIPGRIWAPRSSSAPAAGSATRCGPARRRTASVPRPWS
jgi:Acyl-CoA oxidase